MKTTKNLRAFLLVLPLLGLWSCLSDMPIDDKTEEEKKKDLETEWKNQIDPDGDGIGINPAYVPINWDEKEAVVTDHDAVKGDFTLDFGENEVPELKKGSILTLDVDTAIYLRKVTSVTEANGKVVLKTEQARMDEVFFDTDFELRVGDVSMIDTTKTEDEWEHEYTTRAEKEIKPSRVIYPKEVILTDDGGECYRMPYRDYVKLESGNKVVFDEEKAVSRAVDGERELSFNHHLEANLIDMEHFKFVIDGTINLGIALGLYMNFSTDDSWVDLIDKYDKNRLYMKFTLKPSVGLELNATLKGVVNLKEKESESKKMATLNLAKFIFAVGVVPVEAGVEIATYSRVKVTSSFEGSLTAGVNLSGELQLGFEVSQADGFKPFLKPDLDSGFTPPTFSLATVNNFKLFVTPSIQMKLYEIIGPKLDFSPYFDANLNAGVLADLTDAFDDDKEALALGWDVDAGFGLEADMGVVCEALSKKIFDISSDPITFVKRIPIFESPHSLKTTCNSNRFSTKKWNKVTLDVRSKLLSYKLPTVVPVLVRFDTSGDGWVSDENQEEGRRGISFFSNALGEVSAWWYPTSYDDVLTVKIYSHEGKSIDEKEIKLSSAPGDVQAIDLGGDILWASKNLGANQPEDPGGLYGWGDADGTHKQQCFDKSYGNYVEDPQKCYNYYGGYDRQRNITGGSKDIVHKKWGGAWYIPTIDDWMDLKNYCTFTWTVGGVIVYSNRTKQSIYLPAAGSRWGNKTQDEGKTGEYWTSNYKHLSDDDADEETDRLAWYVYFRNDQPIIDHHYTYRFVGQSVRPVRDKD